MNWFRRKEKKEYTPIEWVEELTCVVKFDYGSYREDKDD